MSGFVGRRSLASLVGYGSGKFYAPDGMDPNGGIAPGANLICMAPGFIRRSVKIDRLTAAVATAAAASNFQLAIYADDGKGNPTGPPLYSSANQSGAVAGPVDIVVNLTLAEGLLWFASNCDSATLLLLASGGIFARFGGTSTSAVAIGSAQPTVALAKAVALGTWPTFTGNRATDGLAENGARIAPTVVFRAA